MQIEEQPFTAGILLLGGGGGGADFVDWIFSHWNTPCSNSSVFSTNRGERPRIPAFQGQGYISGPRNFPENTTGEKIKTP